MFNKQQNYLVLSNDKTNTLSMSDAQTFSNLCNQKAKTIEQKLNKLNNYEKVLDLGSLNNGSSSSKTLIKTKGYKLNLEEVKHLLNKQALYHAFQGYLMQHIRLKEQLVDSATIERDSGFYFDDFEEWAGDRIATYPDRPCRPRTSETDIWTTINKSEILHYQIADAMAADLGKFIHKDSKLDKLRSQLPDIPEYEYENLPDGRVGIVTIDIHHTDDELETAHVELADLHRDAERKVNAIKAKVKTSHSKVISAIETEHNDKLKIWNDFKSKALAHNEQLKIKYEEEKAEAKKEHISRYSAELSLILEHRIQIPKEFKALMDEFNIQK